MKNIRCNCYQRAKLNFVNKVIKNKTLFSEKTLRKKLDDSFYKSIDKISKKPIVECPNTNEICEVFNTPNMGRGIRAKSNLPKDYCIGCYLGELLKNSEKVDNWVYGFSYILNGYYIDGSTFDSITSLINHSEKPNLDVRFEVHNANEIKEVHITFYTNKEILANEELYIDYGSEYWEHAKKLGIRKDCKQRLITEYFNSY